MDASLKDDTPSADTDIEISGERVFDETPKKVELKQTTLSFDQLPTMKKISVNAVNPFNLVTEKKWIVELFPFYELVRKEDTGKNQVKATMKCKSCFEKTGKTSLIADKGTFAFKRHLQVSSITQHHFAN